MRAALLLGEGGDRQFARPAERTAILRNNPVRAVPVGRLVSLRVCEMEAEVRVYLRNRSVPAEAATELQKVLTEEARQGVTVVWKAI
ncbi:hypothetical protein VAWG005_28100 [Aeromonas dhakensis]|nr:hypothetical protein VAWG003_28090 [Aeromonas dhakensis]BEE26882.1 hypothetical protein VAWG005_28100 [Aeromonas dhakensis]